MIGDDRYERIAGVVVSFAAVLAALGYLAGKVRRAVITLKQASRWFEQVLGDRTTTPPTPSLIERLASMERMLQEQGEQTNRLNGELADNVRRLAEHIQHHDRPDAVPNRVRGGRR